MCRIPAALEADSGGGVYTLSAITSKPSVVYNIAVARPAVMQSLLGAY